MPSRFYEQDVRSGLKNKRKLSAFLDILALKHRKKLKKVSFTYIFCSDDALLEINQQFLNHDTLTDIITKAWSDNTTKEYKILKGLKKENLRDNMTNTELILNMLAEASTKDISTATNPETFEDSKKVAKQGGNVAKVARKELEAKTGKKVVTSLNAKSALHLKSSTEKKKK